MRYQIITYGCQMNKSDSERMATELEKKGFKPAKTASQADLIVINVCSIRQSAINRVYSKIKQMKGKKIFLTGCILNKDKKEFRKQVDKILPFASLKTKPKCQSKKQAFIPIMNGCNNFCSYCVVPYVRGREYSRPTREILKQAEDLIKKGYQEITLLGQNVNSYQGEVDFPNLLKLICQIPGKFQIKFMTSHPKDMSDQLIKTISQEEKISKEIHLPVQSGDNGILKKMNRGYTIGKYKRLIRKILKKIPEAKISTDIIVGFPGETEKQFQNSVKLCKEISFRQIYAAAYSPRPGTAAARLKDNISQFEKKQRKRKILELIK